MPDQPCMSSRGAEAPLSLEDRLARIEGYDLLRCLDTAGNRRDVVIRLLRVFSTHYMEGDAALRTALAGGDCKGLARAAHTVRGACATVGATSVAAMAQALEDLLATCGWPSADSDTQAAVETGTECLDKALSRVAQAVASALAG